LLINGLILDEAHCLAQWGENFRPAYYRLGTVRSSLLRHKPVGSKMAIAAFTATADPATQETIIQVLRLQQPQIFRLNPFRPNLRLQVQTVWTPRGRRQQLLQFIQTQGKQAGLVYVRTRRDSETLVTELAAAGYRSAAYHAGLSPQERRQIEQAWLSGAMQFVVCTNAFGMGVDKPNCRWVAHFHAPLLLSEYVQEFGRAGRDGKTATALMLASEATGLLDPADKQRWQFFQQQGRSQQRTAQQLAKTLPTEGDIATVARQHPAGNLALAWLFSTGQLEWQDPFHFMLRQGGRSLRQADQQATDQMPRYLNTRACRWRFLLETFGFTTEATQLQCGSCDNCRRKLHKG
jgi:ATP-dependent DNA helicase RecQ